MKTSRIDWVRFISEESKVSPVLNLDKLASRLGTSELVVRRALLRSARRGLVEHFARKIFINLLARDFSGRELVNVLRPQSYISLETVLRDSGVISQTPATITCVTTGAPRTFSSRSVSITFKHITPELYWGFQQRRTLYGTYNIADPEKALLDWIYLQRKKGAGATTDEFNFLKLDTNKLFRYADKYSKTVKYELFEALIRSGIAFDNSKIIPNLHEPTSTVRP